MAITNSTIEKLEGQIAEVATRQRQVRSEVTDLRQTLDNLREADVAKAVERAGKLTAEILGRETVLKTLDEVVGNYRAQLGAEQVAERERRKTKLRGEVDDYFQEIENRFMEIHAFATSPKLAGLVAALGEVQDPLTNLAVTNRVNALVGRLEQQLLPKYHLSQGQWVRRNQ